MTPRITIDHRVMGGVPCIAGTRIPVATVVGLLGQGYGVEDVLADYSTLTRKDVLAALQSVIPGAVGEDRRGAGDSAA